MEVNLWLVGGVLVSLALILFFAVVSNWVQLSDAQWRTLRTLFQGVTGATAWAAIETYVLPALGLMPDLGVEQRALAIAIMGAIVANIQNVAENRTQVVPTIGKVPVMNGTGDGIAIPKDAKPTIG